MLLHFETDKKLVRNMKAKQLPDRWEEGEAKCGRAGPAPEHTSLAGSRLDEHDAIERYTAAGRKVEVTEFPVDFRTLVWLHLTCDDLTPLAVVRRRKERLFPLAARTGKLAYSSLRHKGNELEAGCAHESGHVTSPR